MKKKWNHIKPYFNLVVAAIIVICFARIWRLVPTWVLLCAAFAAIQSASDGVAELRKRRAARVSP